MSHKVYAQKARYRDALLFILKKYNVVCYFCLLPISDEDFPVRKSDNFTEHHIDGDHSNWDIKNRAVSHTDCHKRHHMSERRSK